MVCGRRERLSAMTACRTFFGRFLVTRIHILLVGGYFTCIPTVLTAFSNYLC
jgi:hypothetical protein